MNKALTSSKNLIRSNQETFNEVCKQTKIYSHFPDKNDEDRIARKRENLENYST